MIKRSNLFALCQWSSAECVEYVYREPINNIYTHFFKGITSELNDFNLMYNTATIYQSWII